MLPILPQVWRHGPNWPVPFLMLSCNCNRSDSSQIPLKITQSRLSKEPIGLYLLQRAECIDKGFAEIFLQDGCTPEGVDGFKPIAGNVLGAAVIAIAFDW